MRLLGLDLFDRNDIAAVLLEGLDTLREAALAAAVGGHCQHIGQNDGEGLVADDVARAPDRMAKAERRLLAGEAHRAGLPADRPSAPAIPWSCRA